MFKKLFFSRFSFETFFQVEFVLPYFTYFKAIFYINTAGNQILSYRPTRSTKGLARKYLCPK